MKKTIFFLSAILSIITLASSAQTFTTAEYLDINNVRARYMVHGDMFWNTTTGNSAYEFPKGSGKHCGFGSSLWIGGIDQTTNTLKVAAQKFRVKGNDYWPGPLDEFNGASIDSITTANWAQIWKINRATIDSFLLLPIHTMANTPKSILEWPGQNTAFAKTPTNNSLIVPDREMAPFIDVNNDNVYNPLDGDYPDIKGEQMLWWVFNDNRAAHMESQSDALKVEIHASAYACNQSGLENTTFLNYKIFNWSNSILDNTVVSLWNDIDIGFNADDYIGFDSTYRMGVTYNGDTYDEDATGYGSSLTQKAVVILKQPSDRINLRSPVGAFTYYTRSIGDAEPNFTMGSEYYNYMTGFSRSGLAFREGCNPFDSTKAITKYVFADDPSIVGGISEVQCNQVPYDRRSILSSAPVQLIPGSDRLEYTFAFINTDTGVDNSNFNELRRLADSAYAYADGCATPAAPLSISRVNAGGLKVYPNPAENYFIIEDEKNNHKVIELYNSFGQVIYKTTSKEQKHYINTIDFAIGLYFLKVQIEDQQFSQSILIK